MRYEDGDMSRHDSAVNYPDDPDGDALRRIAAEGIDMSQPQLIEFAVAVPDEAAGTKIEAALAQHGYAGHLDYDEGEPDEDGEIDPDDEEFGPAWTVYIGISMVPTYDEIMRIQADLDRIAGPHGGRSDGWGVMI
jgi:hypothetical protein